jgi:uncharacterized protein GlcG (DUF336 family)
VTVLNANGEIIVLHRMDNCPNNFFPKFAIAKATTAVGIGISSRVFRDKYVRPDADSPPDKFVQAISMVNITEGKMAPFPGGVVLRDKATGQIIGAIGVSGASSDEDEYCALYGAKTAGLDFITEPAYHSCKTVKDYN